MECPKCGRVVDAGAFICPGCEFILDTSFLGDDITDDERDKRVGKPDTRGPAPPGKRRVGSGVDFGEDAIILGDGQGDYSDFSSRDAGLTREVTQARFYIGGNTAALLNEDAVPEIVPGIVEGSMRMTPFERHVLSFMNGKRSIGRIKKKSGMEDSEFKTSVAMLGDKGIIRVRTTKKKKRTDGSSSLMSAVAGPASRSESSRLAPSRVSSSAVQDGGERTVVATFDIPDAAPPPSEKLAKSEESGKKSAPRESRASASAAEATIVRSAEAPKPSQKSRLPGFASMRVQAEAPADDVERDEDAAPAPTGRAARNVWGDAEPNNISNVFARANPAPKRAPGRPSLVDEPRRALSEGRALQGRAPAPETTGLLSAENLPAPEELLPPGDDDGGFFDARTGERQQKGRSTAPEEAAAELVNAVASELEARLKDPTGMGNLKPVDLRGGAAVGSGGASREQADDEAAGFDDGEGYDAAGDDDRDARAADDDEDARNTAGDVDDSAGLSEPPPTSAVADDSTAGPSDHVFDEVTADPPLRSALSDDPTGPLPARAVADARAAPQPSAQDGSDENRDDEDDENDDDENQDDENQDDRESEGFDVELDTAHLDRMSAQQTASLPDKAPSATNNASVPELPSDALLPLPSQVMKAPPQAAFEGPALVVTRPAPAPAQVAPPSQAPVVRSPAAPPSLPGQSLLQKGAPSGGAVPPRPAAPTVMRGGLPTVRPSATSKVPFEQARKAEKIFEQALKDHAEGRISSARMNAKLAAMYDPSVDAYADFLKALDADGANAKPPGGGKPKELLLFEQASEAEGRGDFDKAVKLLEEAVALAPKAAALRNRLGVVLSIRLKRHAEAMEQLRIAIELEPGNIVYMNNFSKVTALLDSFLDRGPQDKKNRLQPGDNKVEIKKVRPKMF